MIMSFLSSLRNSRMFRRSWSIIYWLPTGIFLSHHFFHVKTVSGRSMQPTLNPDSSGRKDVAIFSKFAVHTTQNYGRDDIVTLRSPEDPRRIIIKRIIAMEGDSVKTLPPYPDREVIIPAGHIWVEGDEHFLSDDSNRFGPIPLGLVESKLVMVVWPPDRFGAARTNVHSKQVLHRNAREQQQLLDNIKREQSRRCRVKLSTL